MPIVGNLATSSMHAGRRKPGLTGRGGEARRLKPLRIRPPRQSRPAVPMRRLLRLLPPRATDNAGARALRVLHARTPQALSVSGSEMRRIHHRHTLPLSRSFFHVEDVVSLATWMMNDGLCSCRHAACACAVGTVVWLPHGVRHLAVP